MGMKSLKTYLLTAVLVPALFLQTACSVSQTTTALGAAQIAVEVVIAALTISGKIPAQYAPQITAWADDATAAFSLTATELASSDTSAVKSLKISGYWGATLTAFTSLGPTEQAYVALAEDTIQDFLNLVVPAGATLNADGTVTYKGITAPSQLAMHFNDKRHLDTIKSKAAKDMLSLGALIVVKK